MCPLALSMLLFGIILSSAFCDSPRCNNVTAVDGLDFTKRHQKWYYCQTSLVNRTANYCYITLKHAEGKDSTTNAELNYYDLETKEHKIDNFVMVRKAPGSYEYPGRDSIGFTIQVTPKKDCFIGYKCYSGKGKWHTPEETGDIVNYICKKPELCDKYPKEIKKLQATKMWNGKSVTLEKFDQETCKSLNLV